MNYESNTSTNTAYHQLGVSVLPQCPAQGDGVHPWILRAAWAAKRANGPSLSDRTCCAKCRRLVFSGARAAPVSVRGLAWLDSTWRRSYRFNVAFRLTVLIALAAGAFLATPLGAMDWSPDTANSECADSNCPATDCKTDAASCVCAKCGQSAKMLAAAIFQGTPLRIETPLRLFVRLMALPEGFVPSIDQPPRKA